MSTTIQGTMCVWQKVSETYVWSPRPDDFTFVTAVYKSVFPMNRYLVGIDPGQVNCGIAQIVPENGKAGLVLTQIELAPTESTPVRLMRVYDAITATLVHVQERWMQFIPAVSSKAVVEQAAYNMMFGQVPLGEARSASIFALLDYGFPLDSVSVLAPATIRKRAFQSGTQHAETYWPELYPDAASALACVETLLVE